MSKKRFKDEMCCSNCRNQMTGFDGGFFGLPFTCECRIYGETENRKNCSDFEKKITKSCLLDKIKELEKENEQLKKQLNKKNTMNMQLREINKELGDDLYNCRLNKNIIREKLKLWQDAHKEYNIYSIKDFEESFELDAKINKEKGI